MEASDIFRRLNFLSFDSPHWHEDCGLCGSGEHKVCSSCVSSLMDIPQKEKLKILIHTRKLDKKKAKLFERVFHCYKLEDADILKRFRKTKKWTREQAALGLKLPKSEITEIERGNRNLSDEARLIIKKMAPGTLPKGSDFNPLEAA